VGRHDRVPIKIHFCMLGVVVLAYNSSTLEAEAGGSQVQLEANNKNKSP
jgi:hypothetical protein